MYLQRNRMHRIFVEDWNHTLRTQLRLKVPDEEADLTAKREERTRYEQDVLCRERNRRLLPVR